MTDVVIAGAVRTSFERLGGALREETTLGLAAIVVCEALERAGAPVAEVDGGAMLVASDAHARELGVVPRGRIVSWYHRLRPRVMGIGPVAATRLALDRAGLTLDDLDVIEINEAFAAQVLAVGKEIEWDDAQVNPHGGAVALGHPLGVATACIDGGQGIALIVERLGSR
jgi:acetyl-CoA acetyltransferase